jgi:hypothetical protein
MRTPITIIAVAAIAAMLAFAGVNSASAGARDIAGGTGIRIGTGESAVFVPWGHVVHVGEALAESAQGGKCTFDFAYAVVDNSDDKEGAFRNHVVANGLVAAVNPVPALEAGQAREVHTQVQLAPGSSEIVVELDAEHTVEEANRDNNAMWARVIVDGKCEALHVAGSGVTVARGMAIGGAAGGFGSRLAAWNDEVTLHAADVALTSRGECAFNISYRVSNEGGEASGVVENKLFAGDALVGEREIASIEAGGERTVMTQAYLAPGRHALRLELDSGGATSSYGVAVNVATDCRGSLSG